MGNQLIIIGNGFDRACGLESTYDAFFEYLAKRSSTTENDKDNIWNQIFRFLHDVNSLMRFFRIRHPLMKYYEKKRKIDAGTDIILWTQEQISELIREAFDTWVRENFDERTQKAFAKQKEQILDTWKQAVFDDWEQENPDNWKDVESVIRDWATDMLSAPNRNIGTTDDLKDIQWIIGQLLTNNSGIVGSIEMLLDCPNIPLPESHTLDKRVQDLLRRYSIPLEELLKWIRSLMREYFFMNATDLLFSGLEKFESEFMDYMRSEAWYNPRYQQRARRLYRLISSTDAPSPVNDYVLSFNYTRPNTAGFTGIRCWWNVHGSLEDGNAIFGFDITDLQPEQRKDHDLIRFTKTYRVLQLPQKPTGQPKLLEPVTDGGSFDAIKVYGHSLDRADYSYFKAIFDCVDLYSSNMKLRFFYPANRPDIGAGLYQSVSDLLTDYGNEMPDKGKGCNLMHRLLLENRLSVTPLDTTSIDEQPL